MGRPLHSPFWFQVLLNELGLDEGFITPLRERYLQPVASVLYPDCGGSCLDSHKAFVVKYAMNEDLALSYHYDNAEVTLNVSIGKEFTDGNLYFGALKQVQQLLFLLDPGGRDRCVCVCFSPAGSSRRSRVFRGGAQSGRGPPASGPANARGPGHLLGAALEPHHLDEGLAGAQQAVPHVQQEAGAGGGPGLRRRLHPEH